MVWVMALTSLIQLSSCVSGHRKSMLSQRASFNPEMLGSGSAWGRREQTCHGPTGSARGHWRLLKHPGSWGSGSVFSLPPGAEGRRYRQRLGSGLRPAQPAGGWACETGATQPWV